MNNQETIFRRTRILIRASISFCVLLSILSCGLFQASDIFKAIETKNQKVIQKWLKNNPDVDLLNDQGQSVLIAAVQAGNKGLVKQLLKRDAMVNVVDKTGRTALDYAAQLHHHKIVLKLFKDEARVALSENLIKVQKVLKRRARICTALCIGLFVVAGLVITAGIIAGIVLSIVPFIFFPLFLPLLIFAPSAASECLFMSDCVACGNFCLMSGIALSLPFVAGSIYSAVSSAYWYRQSRDVQVL